MQKSYQWGQQSWRYGRKKTEDKEQNTPTAAQGTQGVIHQKAAYT